METHRKAHDPRPVTGVSRVLRVLLRCYQLGISPLLGHHCRYEPSCSHYALEAITHWGALRGTRLAVFRVCRCHPWGGSGFDPVPYPSSPPSTSDR